MIYHALIGNCTTMHIIPNLGNNAASTLEDDIIHIGI